MALETAEVALALMEDEPAKLPFAEGLSRRASGVILRAFRSPWA